MKPEILMAEIKVATRNDPSLIPAIIAACFDGLRSDRDEAYKRACDFETATLALLQAAEKGQKNKSGCLGLAADCIMRWKEKTANNWPVFAQYMKKGKL